GGRQPLVGSRVQARHDLAAGELEALDAPLGSDRCGDRNADDDLDRLRRHPRVEAERSPGHGQALRLEGPEHLAEATVEGAPYLVHWDLRSDDRGRAGLDGLNLEGRHAFTSWPCLGP